MTLQYARRLERKHNEHKDLSLLSLSEQWYANELWNGNLKRAVRESNVSVMPHKAELFEMARQ